MNTQTNGKPAVWTDEIIAKWKEAQPDVEAALCEGETVDSCNYFAPRPWRNEYDRGSGSEGFCYTASIGNSPGRRRRVYQGIIATHPIPVEPDEYGKEFLAKQAEAKGSN